MNNMIKRIKRHLIFTVGGALAGLLYYYTVGCSNGSCPITASPMRTALYMALLGWLICIATEKGCDGGCNMR